MVFSAASAGFQENPAATTAGSSSYAGPSYSVKYLGIVDGSMGVLSRKMALLSYSQVRNQKGISTTMPSTTQANKPYSIIANGD